MTHHLLERLPTPLKNAVATVLLVTGIQQAIAQSIDMKVNVTKMDATTYVVNASPMNDVTGEIYPFGSYSGLGVYDTNGNAWPTYTVNTSVDNKTKIFTITVPSAILSDLVVVLNNVRGNNGGNSTGNVSFANRLHIHQNPIGSYSLEERSQEPNGNYTGFPGSRGNNQSTGPDETIMGTSITGQAVNCTQGKIIITQSTVGNAFDYPATIQLLNGTTPVGASYTATSNNFASPTLVEGTQVNGYKVTDANGRIQIVTFASPQTVTGSPTPSTPMTSITNPTCSISSGSMTVTSPIGAGLSYSINNGTTRQTSPTFATLPSGVDTVLVKNSAGCIASAPFTIATAPSTPSTPMTSITNPTCSISSGSMTVTSPIGAGLSYSINNGATRQTSPTFATLPSGVDTVLVKNSAGCIASAPFTIATAPLPPVVNAGVDQSVCAGEQVTLDATSNGTISWNNGVVDNVAFIPSASSQYIATATLNGCTTKDTVKVTVKSKPTINAGINQTIIAGQSATLTANATAGSIINWTTTTNPTPFATGNSTVVSPATTTKYIGVATKDGCLSDPDTTTVTVSPVTGINNNEALSNALILYPNPASDKLSIKLDNIPVADKIVAYEVRDLQGRLIIGDEIYDNGYKLEQQGIDLSTRSAGQYIFLLRTESGEIAAKKIQKE